MADHLEDDEQVEALKRWWDENGKSTMVAIALAVAGTVGWQQYQGWTVSQAERASEVWESISRTSFSIGSMHRSPQNLILSDIISHLTAFSVALH